MNKLKDQFSLVGHLLLGAETRDILAAAVGRIAAIATEVLRLLWMLLCLTFLIFLWGGAGTRKAIATLGSLPEKLADRQPKEKVDLVASTKQALSSVGTNGAAFAIAKAKSQLGIETEPAIVTSETDGQPS